MSVLSEKKLKKMLVTFFQHFFTQFRENFNHDINYTQMKMAHLSRTSPNMSSIGEVCDRLGKTFLTSLVGNHWAAGVL